MKSDKLQIFHGCSFFLINIYRYIGSSVASGPLSSLRPLRTNMPPEGGISGFPEEVGRRKIMAEREDARRRDGSEVKAAGVRDGQPHSRFVPSTETCVKTNA
ncbi:hypothetical protein EVAR_26552_1 [Eumeta japonica]|uniref:Uncharacterized protein n=1 Tax=Eumeta variegata TaxID=151549 RepID=A0A4C1W7M1_EUMVA|nr:hypothetical protein EVAR_26552_1 [Eumeta japonica]